MSAARDGAPKAIFFHGEPCTPWGRSVSFTTVRVSNASRPEALETQQLGALSGDAARVRELRELQRLTLERRREQEREQQQQTALPGARRTSGPPAQNAPPQRPDEVVRVVESRIANARLSPEQKELLRKFAAVSLKRTADPKELPRVVNGVLALVEAWEAINADKTPGAEPSTGVKTVSDYLDEFTEMERAAGEIASVYGQAKPDDMPPIDPSEAAATGELRPRPRGEELPGMVANAPPGVLVDVLV